MSAKDSLRKCIGFAGQKCITKGKNRLMVKGTNPPLKSVPDPAIDYVNLTKRLKLRKFVDYSLVS